MDMDKVLAELNDLSIVQESFIKDEELVKNSKELKRFFSVLMLFFQYNVKSQEFKGKFVNRRYFAGPSENINVVKAILDNKLKGSFHVDAME